jgi:hypothetical protein
VLNSVNALITACQFPFSCIHLKLNIRTRSYFITADILSDQVPKLAALRFSLCSSVANTRWFKYARDDLCVNKSPFVPVIFEPPCINTLRWRCKLSHSVRKCSVWFSQLTQVRFSHVQQELICLRMTSLSPVTQEIIVFIQFGFSKQLLFLAWGTC